MASTKDQAGMESHFKGGVSLFSSVNLNDLSIQQLSSIKKQLDEELEHLTTSFSKLRAAQARFRECEKAIQNGIFSTGRGMLKGASKS